MIERLLIAAIFMLGISGCANDLFRGAEGGDAIGTDYERYFGTKAHPKAGRFVRVEDRGPVRFGIERTPCYGTCPAYSFIIERDGRFRYEGGRYAKRRGRWHGQIAPYELTLIWQYISEMNYFDLANKYTMPESDAPTTYTMVEAHGRKKIVSDYGDAGPFKLLVLERLMDELRYSAKWERD